MSRIMKHSYLYEIGGSRKKKKIDWQLEQKKIDKPKYRKRIRKNETSHCTPNFDIFILSALHMVPADTRLPQSSINKMKIEDIFLSLSS